MLFFIINFEGVQYMPQWQTDYFELKTFENQHQQKEAFSQLSLLSQKQYLPEEFTVMKHSPQSFTARED